MSCVLHSIAQPRLQTLRPNFSKPLTFRKPPVLNTVILLPVSFVQSVLQESPVACMAPNHVEHQPRLQHVTYKQRRTDLAVTNQDFEARSVLRFPQGQTIGEETCKSLKAWANEKTPVSIRSDP